MGGGTPTDPTPPRKITPPEEFYSTEYPNLYETGIEGYEQ